jgi:lipopolysaccharide export system protein LptA
LIKINTTLIFILISSFYSFANDINIGSDKTIIVGDEMELKKAGKIACSKGNSKAFNSNNIVNADKITYDKINTNLSAFGNVQLRIKIKNKESFEAYGNLAQYNMTSQKGKICGKHVLIKYFIDNSTTPCILSGEEIHIDAKARILTTIKKNEKRRPVANVYFGSKKGLYEADKVVISEFKGTKKIMMKGSVLGKIEMKDEKNDIKN